MKKKLFVTLIFFISVLAQKQCYATHLFGADFHYTYVSGNTYTIVLDVYGDCSGTAFPSLVTATPQVQIYNNNVLFQTVSLNLSGPGVEVTPVCPSQINNTTCNGGTIPGVTKYTYTHNVTLNTTSASWLFRFTGNMGTAAAAGRSNNITNILSGTTMQLEATLNNSVLPNSNVTYTTIPTPFFCINKPASYNPGAVDPNGDSLVFNMVPGLIAGGTVTYVAPYTAAAPLAVTTGTFNFSTSTGQLNFTPNLAQKALVVGRVDEYRNGDLVGTSMREMTVVVLGTCNNNPPGGSISNVSGGTLVNGTTVNVCSGQGPFTFDINPIDLDGDSINVVIAGLPTGATANITANGSPAPTINFSWNIIGVTPGAYTFYITYTDNGCPLASKQTTAYTINVNPKPNYVFTLVSPATCIKKAVYTVTPSGTSPFMLTAMQGSSTVHSITNITGTQTDSLAAGTYTIRVSDANTCYKDSTVTFAPPPVINTGFSFTNPTCSYATDGTITASPSGGLAPYQYALNAGVYSSTATFNNLAPGTYTLHVMDANSCVKDTNITIVAPMPIIPSAIVQQSVCSTLGNGKVILTQANGVGPFQYAMNSGAYNSSPIFSPLAAGTYVFHIKDNNNCIKDTSITITDSLHITTAINVTNVLCINQNNGTVTLTPSGGTNPYTFALGAGVYNSSNVIGSLNAGSYVIHIKDVNGCIKDTNFSISQPTAIIPTVVMTQPSCYGGTNGSITIQGTGGTPAYTYALGTGVYSVSNVFSNLAAGTYTFHIKDLNNCIKDTIVTLSQPIAIKVSVIINELKCNGDNSGTVLVSATGGTPTYTFAIDAGPFQTSNTLSGQSAGTHIVHIKDNNGCTKDTTVTITEPAPLSFGTIQIVEPTCEGFTDGKVTLAAVGGTTPYQYSQNGGSFTTNPVFAQLGANSFTFSIKDNNGCSKDTTLNLTGYPHIIIDSVETISASCFGMTDGMAIIFASGGNPPLTFAINNGGFGTSNIFNNLPSATHVIHVKDATGCDKDTSIKINSPQTLTITPTITDNNCIGSENIGSITVNIAGGNAPYTYLWNTTPQQTTQTISDLPNGTYFVQITDSKGCEDTATFEVTYNDCCNVFVPNAFTPNNDGRNDVLRVLYKGDMQLEQMSIYNRYGQRVFYTIKMNDHWDGMFNGEPQDMDTYFYYITVICGNKRAKEKLIKGDVTLIR